MIKNVDLVPGEVFGRAVDFLNCSEEEQTVLRAYRTILHHLGYLRFDGWDFEATRNIYNFPDCMNPKEDNESR